MNVRELIDLLSQAAEQMPDGLDSGVVVHLRDGWDGAGVLTEDIDIVTGSDESATAHLVVVEGRLRTAESRRWPRTAGAVNADLANLSTGDPRSGVTVAIGDTGKGFRVPYGEGGRTTLPGSPEAVAAGCTRDRGFVFGSRDPTRTHRVHR